MAPCVRKKGEGKHHTTRKKIIVGRGKSEGERRTRHGSSDGQRGAKCREGLPYIKREPPTGERGELKEKPEAAFIPQTASLNCELATVTCEKRRGGKIGKGGWPRLILVSPVLKRRTEKEVAEAAGTKSRRSEKEKTRRTKRGLEESKTRAAIAPSITNILGKGRQLEGN